jgi:hypothetical protein
LDSAQDSPRWFLFGRLPKADASVFSSRAISSVRCKHEHVIWVLCRGVFVLFSSRHSYLLFIFIALQNKLGMAVM